MTVLVLDMLSASEVDVLSSLAGTVVFIMFALTLLWIAASFETFDRYGREALRCAAVFIMVIATTRTLNTLGLLIATDARAINTLAGWIVMAILIQVILTRSSRMAMARGRARR